MWDRRVTLVGVSRTLDKTTPSNTISPSSQRRKNWGLLVAAAIVVVLVIVLIPFFATGEGNTPKKAENSDAIELAQPTAMLASAKFVERVLGEKAEFDFGYVPTKAKREVIFLIDNPTTEPVKIRKIRSECKCMNVSEPPKDLAAKSSTAVKVVLVAPAKSSKYAKRILVVTADRKRSFLSLMVKADIGMPLKAQPETKDMGTIVPGQRYETEIKIANRGTKPFRPVYATSTESGCVASVPRTEIPGGGEITIPVKFCVSKKSPGKHSVDIAVHTNCPAQPQIKTKFTYTIPSPAK